MRRPAAALKSLAVGFLAAAIGCGGTTLGNGLADGQSVADSSVPQLDSGSPAVGVGDEQREHQDASTDQDAASRDVLVRPALDATADACARTTCQALGYTCGMADDGCGGVFDCGTCAAPEYCGGGGFDKCGGAAPAACAGYGCRPRTCEQLGYHCGLAGDGCGNLLDCGPCAALQTCSGDHQCVPPEGGACTPWTCQTARYECGSLGDGCTGFLHCGTCPAPQYCGGGGAHRCGGSCESPDAGACTVLCSSVDGGACGGYTCLLLGCGLVDNGCGTLLDCGACPIRDGGAADAPIE